MTTDDKKDKPGTEAPPATTEQAKAEATASANDNTPQDDGEDEGAEKPKLSKEDYELLFYGLVAELRSRASILPVLGHMVDAAIAMTSKRPTRSVPLNLLLASMKRSIDEVRAFQGDLLPTDDPESSFYRYARPQSPETTEQTK